MNKKIAGIFISLSILILFFVYSFTPANEVRESENQAQAPNILVFVADDASWRDSGAYGNDQIITPNIDALAKEGLLFENAFLTTPQCSPSRISILAGKHPHATGAEDLHMPLPEGTRIVPSYLKEAGYFNGHMQKTHYGEHADAQFDWYSPDLSEDFGEFLNEAHGEPFFLWVGFSDPHRDYGDAPEKNNPDNVIVPPFMVDDAPTRGDLAQYYDEITRMDSQIGSFLEEMKQRGLAENTLVVYISDNGAPFPREKGTLYDSGIKTPLIFKWPGHVPEGSRYNGLATILDLAPTLLDVAGVDIPEEFQGESIRDVFDNQSLPGHEYVFSQRNWHDADEHMRSLRSDRYKLVRNDAYTELPHGTPADIGGSPSFRSLIKLKETDDLTAAQSRLFEVPRARIELYDLEEDPWELNNVAAHDDYWELARTLSLELDIWIEESGDFPPHTRVRDDHTDRLTGVWFSRTIPPMRNIE